MTDIWTRNRVERQRQARVLRNRRVEIATRRAEQATADVDATTEREDVTK